MRKIIYFIVFLVSLSIVFFACKKYNDMCQANIALTLNSKAYQSLNFDEAIALFNQSIALHQDPFVYEDLGDLYLIRGNDLLAIKSYNNAIDVLRLKDQKANEILLAKKEILQNRIQNNTNDNIFNKITLELENKQKNNHSYVSLIILSKLYLAAGYKDKALALLAQAKQYNNQNKFIDIMIMEIKKNYTK